ncbi:hypothetical protein ABZX92_38760 [Lentzea sp. NPDC006480]
MLKKIAVTIAATAALFTLGAGAALADGVQSVAPACYRGCAGQ